MVRVCACWVVAAALAAFGDARAQDASSSSPASAASNGSPADESPDSPGPAEVRAAVVAPRNWLNLRGGFGAQPVDAVGARPQICGEVSPLDWLGVEACGTGAGFLFESGSELVHVRGKVRLASVDTGYGFLEPRLALGFAELQVGDDAPGFDFFGAGPTGVETAGPEAGASLRWSHPLAWDFEMLADASLGMAWLPYAPQLTTSMSPWQPSATLTLGVGW